MEEFQAYYELNSRLLICLILQTIMADILICSFADLSFPNYLNFQTKKVILLNNYDLNLNLSIWLN